MLMQCLSEYSVKCDFIKIDEEIEHHNKYKLAFLTEVIIADSFNHYEKKFIELENVEMNLIIPYSMSLKESLEQMKFIFRIKSASINIVVADFEHFFQLVVNMNALSEKSFSILTVKPSLTNKTTMKNKFASMWAKSRLTLKRFSKLSLTILRQRNTFQMSVTLTFSFNSFAYKREPFRSQ